MGRQKVIHLIAQAHLDPVWLWQWNEGYSEVLTTMQSAIDRLNETHDLRFSRSSAITYRWVEQTDTQLFREIFDKVKEGRWEIVNGWIVQPDCNMPSTESFIRHALYGKNYFNEKFGYDVKVGYNVDSFGHSGGLPQILNRSGYKYYVFMRPKETECEIPTLFWWQSADGSRVLAWRIKNAYCQPYFCKPEELEELLISAVDEGFVEGFEDTAFFLGVGNHGGGPTKKQIEKIEELKQKGFPAELRYSTLKEFFSAIEKSPNFANIPVIEKELQHHATGCYSSVSEIKMLNRRAEKAMFDTEAISVCAKIAKIAEYPRKEITGAWWQILFNQFHDILAGSSLKRCYVDARDSLGGVCDITKRISTRLAHAFARRVDTRKADLGVLFVFNSLPWQRKALVQFDYFTSPDGEKTFTCLKTDNEQIVPLQLNTADSSFGPHGKEWKKLTAILELPPCGYKVFALATDKIDDVKPNKHDDFVTIREDILGISSLKAQDNRELLAKPIVPVVIDDPSDAWGHEMYKYDKVLGYPELISTKLISDGSAIKTYRQIAKWNNSDIILDISIIPELEIVELHIRVNWQEKHKMLKLEVPTILKQVTHYSQTPGTVAERMPDGFEEPGQDWVALEGIIEGETYSLGLINNGSYSYDCLNGNVRSVIARSAIFAKHDPFELSASHLAEYMDNGWLEKKFWIIRAKSVYKTLELSKLSNEMQIGVEYVIDSSHSGTEPWEKSFVEIHPACVSVLSVKKAEADNDAIIVRLQEINDMETQAIVSVPICNIKHKITLKKYEIKTLKISLSSGKVSETNLLEN